MYRPPISALAPYLYEAWYNDTDYAYALEWFRSHTPVTAGGCSTVRKGNLIGRNLDWTYSESAEFIVHTGNTVGVANAIPTLTDAFVKSGTDSELYKIVPFMLSDGMNKHGLVVSTLVVPTDKGDNSVVRPMELEFEEVCTLMLPRFVLDRFVDADSACGYLMRFVRLYHPKTLQDQKYDQHFVIADKYDTYCMEFIDGQYFVHDISGKPYVTNFHLIGVEFNPDGSVHTPATGGGSINRITPNGSGLERYNLINAHTGDIQALMKDLAYTRAYQSHSDPAVPRWDTEFVGNGRTVDTPASGYDSAQAVAARMYLDRSRALGDTWQTVHSAIYDIENKTLRVAAQENFDTQWEVSVMSDQVHVQHLRGNTAKNDAFTGLEGEITVDIQGKTARVHDGITLGGYELVTTSTAQTITGAKMFASIVKADTPLSNVTDNSVVTAAWVRAILPNANGFKVNPDGTVSVDFSQLDDATKDTLRLELEVPIPLKSATNFYVNGATGSDTLDEGRGLSAEKPFKTIQACATYVANTYDLRTYVATINVASGVYNERLSLGSFTRTTGYVRILGDSSGKPVISTTVTGAAIAVRVLDGEWMLDNVDIEITNAIASTPSTNAYIEALRCGPNEGARFTCRGVNVVYKTTSTVNSGRVRYRAFLSEAGRMNISGNIGITIEPTVLSSIVIYPIFVSGGSVLSITKSSAIPFVFNGDYPRQDAFVTVNGFSRFSMSGATGTFTFNAAGGVQPVGAKHNVTSGSCIDSNTEYNNFLGTLPGTVEAETYSWVK